jgi:hypothetical protein
MLSSRCRVSASQGRAKEKKRSAGFVAEQGF